MMKSLEGSKRMSYDDALADQTNALKKTKHTITFGVDK